MPRREPEELDLSVLYDATIGKQKIDKTASTDRILLADNTDRFTKVGFDLFRDNESDCIWKVEKDQDDAIEYLIRTELVAETPVTASASASSHWSATADIEGENLTLAYKGTPIKRFEVLRGKTVGQCANLLLNKVSEDKKFVDSVLEDQPEERKTQLRSQHPELY